MFFVFVSVLRKMIWFLTDDKVHNFTDRIAADWCRWEYINKWSLNGTQWALFKATTNLMKKETYCYAKKKRNDLILFNIKKNKTNATLTHMYNELFISKPTITSIWAWEKRKRNVCERNKRQYVHKHILINISKT